MTRAGWCLWKERQESEYPRENTSKGKREEDDNDGDQRQTTHQHRILYPVFSSYVTCSVRATCSGSEIAIAVANADGERLPNPPAPVLLPILACSEARRWKVW